MHADTKLCVYVATRADQPRRLSDNMVGVNELAMWRSWGWWTRSTSARLQQ
jgi:hypothetical protein